MTKDSDDFDDTVSVETPLLGTIGLENFEPYLMNRIMGRYNATLRDDMAGMGLTTAKMRALAVLSVVNRPLIRELSVYAVVEQSTLSRALDALEREGRIRREADGQDARATRVVLTDEGRSAFEQLWPTMAGAYEDMFRGVAPEDRAAFLRTLKTMLLNIRRNKI
ncbi:MAG: MarR family winged helix-turn-helix transcriptional regulator [Paracoccaceae bacterium]